MLDTSKGPDPRCCRDRVHVVNAGRLHRSSDHWCPPQCSRRGEPRFELGPPILRDREGADGALPRGDALERPLLLDLLLHRGLGDLRRERRRQHDDALTVTDEDVAGDDRDARAGDRHLVLERHVQAPPRRGMRRLVIHRQADRADGGCVAQRAVGDDAGRSEQLRAHHEDVADRACMGLAAASMTSTSSGVRLSMGDACRVLPPREVGQVLPGGHVPERVGVATCAAPRRPA